MPEYTIPPWLVPKTDPAAEFDQSFRQAQQISTQMQMEQQRLAVQQQQGAMEAQAKQEQLAQKHEQDQQELAVQKAYQDQQIDIRRKDLEQGQQQIQMQAQQAARKFAAQQAFQQEVGDASDLQTVTRAMLKYGTEMGEPGAAILTATRMAAQSQSDIPPSVQTIQGERFARMPGATGTRWQHLPQQSDVEGRELRMNIVRELERKRDKLEVLHRNGQSAYDLAKERPASKQTVLNKSTIAAFERDEQKLKEFDDQIAQSLQGLAAKTSRTASTNASGRIFKHKNGKRYRYTGDVQDPKTDKNPDHWEEI